MKFYDCSTAPSPRRVRIFAAEKGLQLDTAQVDLGSGEQFSDAFRNTAKRMKNHAISGPDGFAQIPELADRGRARVGLFLDKMNDRLAERAYVLGDNYSLADITLLVVMDFTKWTKIPTPDAAVHLKRWYDDVAGRPSASA